MGVGLCDAVWQMKQFQSSLREFIDVLVALLPRYGLSEEHLLKKQLLLNTAGTEVRMCVCLS